MATPDQEEAARDHDSSEPPKYTPTKWQAGVLIAATACLFLYLAKMPVVWHRFNEGPESFWRVGYVVASAAVIAALYWAADRQSPAEPAWVILVVVGFGALRDLRDASPAAMWLFCGGSLRRRRLGRGTSRQARRLARRSYRSASDGDWLRSQRGGWPGCRVE